VNTNQNNQNPKQPKRRSTLKSLLLGGGAVTLGSLPAQWVKPVVDTVALPAHAQTTTPARNGFTVPTVAQAPGLLDRLIPTAHASEAFVPGGFLCIERSGSGWEASYDVGGPTLTGSGEYGACVTLECGRLAVDLIVLQANEDGSFDFELYPFSSGCGGPPVVSNTTNEPCTLGVCTKEPF
jgi:hypothetical protein